MYLVRTQNFPNNYISKRLCAFQGFRNVSFSDSFVYVVNGWYLTQILILQANRKFLILLVSTILEFC